jgi:hypothetical protein
MRLRTFVPFVVLVLASAEARSAQVGSSTVFHQTITLSGVSAMVDIRHERGDLYVYGAWVNQGKSTYPVGCLSVWTSRRYELRNSAQQIIPVNQGALHPRYMGPGELGHAAGYPPSKDCKTWTAYWSAVGLSKLYPHLQYGTYTFQITFAPAGLGEAKLRRVVLTLPVSH